MYLAIKEMKHNKLRYALIIVIIMLISYLIFILTSLATGLDDSNRQVIDSWHAQAIILNNDADGVLRRSSLNPQQVQNIQSQTQSSALGELAVTVRKKGQIHKTSAELLGIKSNQFIYQNLKISQGRKFIKNSEIVVDASLFHKGYQLGDYLQISTNTPILKIVGFTHNAQLSVSPVIYTTLATWRQVKYGMIPAAASSAVFLKKDSKVKLSSGLTRWPTTEFINKLPGYQAQSLTFEFMIGFLMLITLIIIAIFLYILTIQKLPLFAVMKAQGIPTHYLIGNTIGQALVITIIGIILGAVCTLLTKLLLPSSVPISFNYYLLTGAIGALMLMSLLGSLIPIRTIKKIDPAAMIGGN